MRLEPLRFGGETYTPVPEEPDAELTITRLASGTLFELALDARLDGPCMRCLEAATVEVRMHAREYQASVPAAEELRTPYLADDRLDLSAWARDAVALALPERILCAETCHGLCAGCGANLNAEACRCAPEPVDPRFEKLAELRERLAQ